MPKISIINWIRIVIELLKLLADAFEAAEPPQKPERKALP